jgi:hypothetical protein
MTGGLMQLVGKGAQDQLIVGNPSFTHFRSVYKKHTDFAMEHFRLVFKTTNLNLPPTGSLTLRAKVERYAQLVHDCYLTVTLPNIYSPVSPITPGIHPEVNALADAIGYEFQWVRNLGYNMINHVSILVNGQEIVRHTGEWMKLYANTKFDSNKKDTLNRMMGNIPELYDPANAYDRLNQYPHAISSISSFAEPSIPGRILQIPLHFWFCENVGAALPLTALQYSEVEIVVELKNLYQLFTIRDVRDSDPGGTFGNRIAPNSSFGEFTMNRFLSPPLYLNPTAPIQVYNPDLRTWNLNPYIEANYIFLTDVETVHIAKTDHSFPIHQIDSKETYGQHGPSNDLELTMKNLCTRIVWVAQRSDRALENDYDNYTNWENPYKSPLDSTALAFMTPWYSSGVSASTAVSARDILLESSVILDGKERFAPKNTNFFSDIQNYRHHAGKTISEIPGIYTYSFALDHNTTQPSGHINGSMFNKTILRNTYVQPPLTAPGPTTTTVCVLKSTAGNANPTVVLNPNVVDPDTGKPLYSPDQLITIIRKTDAQTLQYTYNVRAYVESYNYLRVLGGVANVVFSS